MYYEFNISHQGTHVFATHERSGDLFPDEAKDLYELLLRKFPTEEGFKVSIELHDKSCIAVTEEEILNCEDKYKIYDAARK